MPLLADDKKIQDIRREGLITAAGYTVKKAALSELDLFRKFLPEHKKSNPVLAKSNLTLMPSRRADGRARRIRICAGFVTLWQCKNLAGLEYIRM